MTERDDVSCVDLTDEKGEQYRIYRIYRIAKNDIDAYSYA